MILVFERRAERQTTEHHSVHDDSTAHNANDTSSIWPLIICSGHIHNTHYAVACSTVWIKKIPPPACGFLTFFDKRLRILNQFFTHLLYVPIYARLQIFIQLSQTLTKLCHIKRDYLVHIICSKYPPSAETHAFRRLRKSMIALLIVICGKSSQICCFYNVNKHAGYDMTSTVTSFAQ